LARIGAQVVQLANDRKFETVKAALDAGFVIVGRDNADIIVRSGERGAYEFGRIVKQRQPARPMERALSSDHTKLGDHPEDVIYFSPHA
jgi:hypothetical protein